MQHLVTALTTSEKLVSNAKHVFNISSVTSGGNLYKHLFIQDMKINIKLRRNYQSLVITKLLPHCSEIQVLRPMHL